MTPGLGRPRAAAYVIVQIDRGTGRVLDCGIYSERNPTTINNNILQAVLMKIEASEYEYAVRQCITWARGQHSPWLNMMIIRYERERAGLPTGTATINRR